MRKKLFVVLTTLLLGMISAQGQIVYIEDEDQGHHPRVEMEYGGPISVIVPMQDINLDQYLPLGEGWLLLVGLGGCYLLKKRKTSSRHDGRKSSSQMKPSR